MTYIPTPLKREIIIDAVVTIHYFEYMRDFVFPGSPTISGNSSMWTRVPF